MSTTILAAAGATALAASCSGGNGTEVSTDSDKPFVVTGVEDVTQIAQLTGAGAINDTEAVGVAGTDLGSMFTVDDRTYFVFGDTFGTRDEGMTGGGGGNWRSNAIAYSTDDDPTDGITFDGWVLDDVGLALEVAVGDKAPNDGEGEVTKIPTHGFAVDGSLYLQYMSVSYWGEPGAWDANHAGLVRSTDDGQTWEVLEEPQWPGDSNVIQVSAAHVTEGGTDYLYFWSIPSGRFGGVQLMRVPATTEAVEDLDSYTYFAGTDGDGRPTWSDDLDQAAMVLDRAVGELSVMYHEQTERWLLTTMIDNGDAVLFEGLTPWGPWSDPHVLTTQAQTPGLYGPYMNPRYVSEDGRTIYFTLSIWDPYNVFWYSATLATDD
ncbi:DUF4185 domain-containing protein [Pseudactinotalea sp.]|uniref:DUF4185 domain-containing protein n=1 Tax=Pseudactinotalea sp. TaxID=1926260 RepID=UPI003B3A4CFB